MTAAGNVTNRNLAEVKILGRRDITPDLWLVWLEKPEGYSFKPGQYCTIGRNGIERAYSIVSAPHEKELELFIELVPLPEGQLTPKLWEVGIGESVTIRPRAKGLFTMKSDFPNQLMVATVTGVVPYISIIRDYLHYGREGHRFYVLHGASYIDEFVYDDEISDHSSARSELITYIPSVSRPTEKRNDDWSGETGRVNTIVDGWVDKLRLTPEDTVIYACGHPGMIEDIKERMIPKGFRIEEERFWKQG